LFNLLNGIPLSIWYDWKNDGTDPHEVEHNFGTVTDQLKPKPAYTAVKVLTHELAGYRIERRLETDGKDFVLLCVNNSGGTKLAAWTTGEPHAAKVKLPAKTAEHLNGTKGTGGDFTVQMADGQWVIELEQLPEYVTVR
jgi:hypothetical protein